MTMLKVKTKAQITLPSALRKQAGIDIGDFVDAKFEKGKITLSPKSWIDRRLALSLEDVRMGRVSPRFEDVEDMIKYLKKKTKKYRNDSKII